MIASAPAAPPRATLDREVVARIIDPEAFALIAHYDGLSYVGAPTDAAGKRAKTFEAYPNLKQRHDDAFAKADQIIALTAVPPEDVGEG